MTITPFVRVALPLGRGHEDRVIGVEPGASLRLDFAVMMLDARLALLVASDAVLRADALVALTWRPDALVSLALSGETNVDLAGDDLQSVLGLGVNLHFGDVRLGLALGLGLGEATRSGYGAALGRLVIDVGLPQ